MREGISSFAKLSAGPLSVAMLRVENFYSGQGRNPAQGGTNHW